MEAPTLWIVAGPNGVGKTTYAFRHIRSITGSTRFVNLDEIARGLSPLDPQSGQRRAGRVALDMMRDLIQERRSFSIETTLSGRTHLQLIASARNAGFRIILLFFAVRNVDICRARIDRRVTEGGHNITTTDLRRRFVRGIGNLPRYLAAVDLWRLFDNNGSSPVTVAEGKAGCIAVRGDWNNMPAELTTLLMHLPDCPEA